MDAVSTKPKTPLADKLAGEGGVLCEYSGVETVATFGDVDREFRSITEGSGVYDLGWRGKIAAIGGDRTRWLNGMVTNNIKDLAINRGNYNFLLNSQGRILGDLYVYNRGEKLVIDTERSQVEHLMKTLDHFIIMDDVELKDESEQITSVGIQGPDATEVLKAAGISPDCADPLTVCDVKWNGATLAVTRMASDDFLTYEIWLGPEKAADLWSALRAAGAVPAGTEALEKFRVLAGVPKYGTDITAKHLPQETGQDHALNFSKGCYIGQEIVERIRSRANVHRTFGGFEGSEAVIPGAKITDESAKEVGEITSAATIPAANGERYLALGFIRKDAMTPASGLNAGKTAVKSAKLPFKL